MSRIGKQPIKVPEKVKVLMKERHLVVEGPLGRLEKDLDPSIDLVVEGSVLRLTPRGEGNQIGALHGLYRNIVRNMVEGVAHGFKKELEINGIGYRAEVKGEILNLTLGFSHPVEFKIPNGIKMQVEKMIRILISGASRELVGETAARIRRIRPPEPYKGKGIKYAGEVIIRKVGKAAVSAGGQK